MNRKSCKILSACLLASLTGWHVPLPAAEDESTEPTASATQPDEAAEAEQSAQAQVQTDSTSAGDITPTEEISEDLSVPFPVDI